MALKVTPADLTAFCVDQLARYEAYRVEMGFESPIHAKVFTYTTGPKYARIIAERAEKGRISDRYVVCFINMENGDIHKADGWKKPCTVGATKGVRGNIFTPDRGASCMTQGSTRYL